MNMRAFSQRGFNMIEMMIVLCVFAILALMAVPNYSNQIIRKQIADGLPLIDFMKPPLENSWKTMTVFPVDNAAAALPTPTQIVNNTIKSVTVENGAIHVVFGNRAHAAITDQTLTIRPAVVDAAPTVPVTWLCGYASAPGGMSVKGVDRTTIPATDLPVACRP